MDKGLAQQYDDSKKPSGAYSSNEGFFIGKKKEVIHKHFCRGDSLISYR
jgi:hypothetical protein